jgi:hypothetical protein
MDRLIYMCAYDIIAQHRVCRNAAPAGGAAAAAPEGDALAGPSASPHLPVVGDGNPVAVPGLAR